jgi:uncharacterized protein YecE (DUF72 family)
LPFTRKLVGRINHTFYGLPSAATFDAWRREVPDAFTFALKFSRYASHMKRLRQPAAALRTFCSRARRLASHLGPVLVQLPPRWRVDRARLAAFLAAAPRAYRWAIEFRDESWLCDAIYEVLRAHGAALCVHDLIPEHPFEITADWVYLRYHGRRYAGSYSRRALRDEARRLRRCLARGLDVYAYFNNDLGAHAVSDAIALRRLVLPRRRGAMEPLW